MCGRGGVKSRREFKIQLPVFITDTFGEKNCMAIMQMEGLFCTHKLLIWDLGAAFISGFPGFSSRVAVLHN